ncbi:ABC transporter permease [Dokdonella sp.]|uniref:ABC transporter permease n=1 Tax=Dokdonella sp. TaxID=2291710 RepID=UPI0025B9139D|nr:ABC transporter permease [Dokdonella sp.]MBX3689851.1 ABC transporter permease [Dokdonella sp.]
MSTIALTYEFAARELRARFAGSFAGILWAVFQPALQLAIFAFVFVKVFNARIPGADAPGYVAFLAVALWPWTAFSDAILNATKAIQDNAALIGKVAFPRAILVMARVCASFVIHLLGFVVIVVALNFFDDHVRLLAGLPLALLLYVPLFALALGISLLLAALQVFVRDLVQLLAQLLPLLLYCAPVFYDRTIMPVAYQPWLSLNPFTFYAEAFHAIVLDHGVIAAPSLACALLVAAGTLLCGYWLFTRLDKHFEDFL